MSLLKSVLQSASKVRKLVKIIVKLVEKWPKSSRGRHSKSFSNPSIYPCLGQALSLRSLFSQLSWQMAEIFSFVWNPDEFHRKQHQVYLILMNSQEWIFASRMVSRAYLWIPYNFLHQEVGTRNLFPTLHLPLTRLSEVVFLNYLDKRLRS